MKEAIDDFDESPSACAPTTLTSELARGRIYKFIEQYEPAIVDLEAALSRKSVQAECSTVAGILLQQPSVEAG